MVKKIFNYFIILILICSNVFATSVTLRNGQLINGKLRTHILPTDITEFPVGIWLDAADDRTVNLNGSNISQWNDKSGNGYHLSEGTAANQPDYDLTAMNGFPGLSFDGSNDRLRRNMSGTFISDPSISGGLTVFVVFRHRTIPGTRPIFSSGATNAEVYPSRGIIYGAFSGNPRCAVIDDAERWVSAGSLYSLNTNTIGIMRWDGTNLESWTNGVFKGSVTASSWVKTDNRTFLALAQSNTGAVGTSADIVVSELFMFPGALSDTVLWQLNDSLVEKWGF
jgi:hypothetical protein